VAHLEPPSAATNRRHTAKALVLLNTPEIEANIEHTRFPVPEDEQHESTDDFPSLVRAADLIANVFAMEHTRLDR
jgi:hypothetical protein